MTEFQGINDFWGEYEGSHDGRRAKLTISDTKADSPVPLFLITFEDLDRGVTSRGEHRQPPQPELQDHILTDVSLDRVGGSGTLLFRSLLLHTWNTNYITGINIYKGREYGNSFERT